MKGPIGRPGVPIGGLFLIFDIHHTLILSHSPSMLEVCLSIIAEPDPCAHRLGLTRIVMGLTRGVTPDTPAQIVRMLVSDFQPFEIFIPVFEADHDHSQITLDTFDHCSI